MLNSIKEIPKKKNTTLDGCIIAFFVVLVIFILIGIFSGGGEVDNNSDTDQESEQVEENESTEESEQPDEPESYTEEPEEEIEYINVSMADFVEEYDINQIAAEKKYTGQYIESTGYISNISEGFTGNIYVSINPTNEEFYFGTNLTCYPSNEDDVLSLENGQAITIRGLVGDQDFGIIDISECAFVE